MTPIDVRAYAQSGVDALRRGDARAAREAFGTIVSSGQADASSFVGLAYACQRLDDKVAALAAVDKALALEPRNLRALMFKADRLVESGDERSASSYFRFVTKIAPPAAEMPVEVRDEVARAQAMCDRYAGQFEDFLKERLVGAGLVDGQSAARFGHSLDIMLGRKQIYFQQPRTYFFPELPQIQFYPRNAFPWLDQVEAATADIQAELAAILTGKPAFQPYLQDDPKRPRKEHEGMTGNPDWSAFYLWKDGAIVAENAARCPRTMQAMQHVPLSHVTNRSPSVLFSLLRPGAHIPPHTGLVNTRLICHLPLLVPPGCTLRVGNDTRTPVEGKAWVFDDTIEHEAWNRSDRTRVILLFEVWRPELTADERRLVAALFEAIDGYTGEKPEWTI